MKIQLWFCWRGYNGRAQIFDHDFFITLTFEIEIDFLKDQKVGFLRSRGFLRIATPFFDLGVTFYD